SCETRTTHQPQVGPMLLRPLPHPLAPKHSTILVTRKQSDARAIPAPLRKTSHNVCLRHDSGELRLRQEITINSNLFSPTFLHPLTTVAASTWLQWREEASIIRASRALCS